MYAAVRVASHLDYRLVFMHSVPLEAQLSEVCLFLGLYVDRAYSVYCQSMS